MKRLLHAPLLLMLTSCGYGSSYEAELACKNFQEKLIGKPAWCIDDPRTRKYLLEIYDFDTEKYRVVKRFSY